MGAVTPPPCVCGHARADHIHEESACRPGFTCQRNCQVYEPQKTKGSAEVAPSFGEMSKRRLEALLRMERSRADAAERRVRELEYLITRLDL